jgi:hypothetical protein
VNCKAGLFLLGVLAIAQSLFSQNSSGPYNSSGFGSYSSESRSVTASPLNKYANMYTPFSRLAVGGGISLMGVNLQAATNINQHLNVRGSGNFFKYSLSNIDTGGFNIGGQLSFASAGASLDYYPFPSHGFRVSPGLLFYNGNQVTGSGIGSSGSSITLNSTKYYSETADPIGMNATLGLNTHKQAFTMTTGFGNMIPHNGGHWSFPFELGAAFTGVPTVNVLMNGHGCTSQLDVALSGPSCVNMATDPNAQANLNSQIGKWTKNLNDLQVYPILSFGAGYAFRIR